MKLVTKTMCVLLALVMLFSLSACGNENEDGIEIPNGFLLAENEDTDYYFFYPATWILDRNDAGMTSAYVSENDFSNISITAFTASEFAITEEKETAEEKTEEMAAEQTETLPEEKAENATAETEKTEPEVTEKAKESKKSDKKAGSDAIRYLKAYAQHYYFPRFTDNFKNLKVEKNQDKSIKASTTKIDSCDTIVVNYTAVFAGEEYSFRVWFVYRDTTIYTILYTAKGELFEEHMDEAVAIAENLQFR